MSIREGTRLGPYEVVSPIGAGGMGEVWRGKDTRLGREVAIKVLPSQFAHSAQFKIRFEREAKAISALNHPNICTLFDVGESEVVGSVGETHHYIVMELIEGESLADRIAKGPLPLDQVLRYGAQIADALQRAHRQGIIHRDLKPGNIMLTKSGAKLLDFGLARSTPENAPLQGLTQGPTEARPLTQEGTIVGTFQYMAPEQLEGVEADARTDIFAYGAVLYEMATGRRAFQGATRSSLIAAIVSSMPQPIGEIVPLTPPALEHVVRKCLAKDPDERWQSAHDIADQLRWISEAGSRAGEAAPIVARRKSRLYLAWGLHAITALAAVALTLGWIYATRARPSIVTTSVLAPEKTTLDVPSGAMALSPDGKRLAFVARKADGGTALFIRPLSGLASQQLTGTDGARFPFWSPDSRSVGFFADGKLRKIDASGGPPQALCDAPDGRGGSWSDDGTTILFTPGTRDPIFKVPSSGGSATAVTTMARDDLSHRFPEFLPGSKSFLFLIESTREGPTTVDGFVLHGMTLGAKERKAVVATNASARYAKPGRLLFLRDRTLVAQKFDSKTFALEGEAVPVAENVTRSQRYEAIFSVSQSDGLIYQQGDLAQLSQLTWMDRDGREIGPTGKPMNFREIRLSPDARRVLATVTDPKTQKDDIWTLDLERGTSSRLTFNSVDEWGGSWSPDGRTVYFTSARVGRGDIFSKSASGTGEETPFYSSPEQDQLRSISADGRIGAIMTNNLVARSGWDILIYDFATKKAKPLLVSPFIEAVPVISPDGRWVAYMSNESGRFEIYVQSLGDATGKWQVSTDGGSTPTWTKGGRELLFMTPNRKLMAVDVTAGEEFSVSVPRQLFELKPRALLGRQFDVSADGTRILVNHTLEEADAAPMTLVQQWQAGLTK